jgi:hypothetical protein
MPADLDVAVVRSVPLIECFENVNLMPAKMKSPGRGHSAMISMLLDVNTHFWFQGTFETNASSLAQAVKCRRAGFLARGFAPFAAAEPTGGNTTDARREVFSF